jgi:hypothetical protein
MNFTPSGWYMDNKGKCKSFPISDEINILAQVGVNIGTCVELPSRTILSTLNAVMKNCEEIDRS